MKAITVTAARRRFGAVLDAAQTEPVMLRRHNRDVLVILSMEEYERISGPTSFKPRHMNSPKKAGSRGPL